MLTGKTVILAVSGSIAAYKMPNLARMLKKLGCDVQVLMTANAANFINPITFETLTGNKCLIDTFDRNFQYSVEHVALAKKADVQDGKDGFDREKYYDYIDEYEKALHDYNAYRKAKRNGDDEAGQKAEKLKESPTGERMDIIRKDIRKIRNKDKQVRRIDEKENPTAEEEARRDKLKTESNELKQQLVEELDSISNAEKK